MNREIQKKVEEFKLRHDRKKSLEAKRQELVQEFDTQIAAEAVALQALLVDLVGWSAENLREGDKVVHYGVRIERKAGKPRVGVRPDLVEEEIAASLEKKIPGLVVVERKINRQAILTMAANPDNAETMRLLKAVGITVERPTMTRVQPIK